MTQTEYNAKSIEQLTFREGVRKRIGIYLGSADHTGVLAGLLELVNNATDEALVCPTATKIELVIGQDWASCRDYGRGMPHGPNDFTDEVMINLLTENHSGAKFGENAYGGKSRGCNGTGSAATCCSSDWFEISSYRDGAEWFMRFEKGIPQSTTCIQRPLKTKGGTYIKYKPSQEVFNAEPIKFDFDEICDIIEEYSYFNKGIEFVVTNAGTDAVKTYLSKNGLIDFAKHIITNPVHPTPIYYSTTENGIDLELIMQWTRGKERSYLFSNGGENESGGTPITGIKMGITTTLKKEFSGDFDGDMLRTGLVYICSVNLKNPIYDGQTKSKLTNPELRGLAQRATSEALKTFATTKPAEYQSVIDFLARERKAEVAAENARKKVQEAVKDIEKNQKRKVFASDKLKDAEYLGKDSILLCVEGNSAASSMAVARDIKKYGILALRGKIINCLANKDEDIFENEEIKLLLSALNITPGGYNSNKLRYGRVAIASDGDADGGHIGLLIAAALRYLAPQFINEGRLCWLRTPLYIVKNGKTESYYYTDAEMDTVKGKIRGEVQRNKGLGSMSAQQAHDSMFNPTYQRLEPIIPNEEGIQLLEDLMGEDVSKRRDFIFNNIDFSIIHE